MLDKTTLLSAVALKTEPVSIGGDQVLVSEISAGDWFRLWSEETKGDGQLDAIRFTTRLVLCALVDETGQRLFSDDELHLIERFPRGQFDQLAAAAKRINGLDEETGKN